MVRKDAKNGRLQFDRMKNQIITFSFLFLSSIVLRGEVLSGKNATSSIEATLLPQILSLFQWPNETMKELEGDKVVLGYARSMADEGIKASSALKSSGWESFASDLKSAGGWVSTDCADSPVDSNLVPKEHS